MSDINKADKAVEKISTYLGYLGLLPFYICLLLSQIVNNEQLEPHSLMVSIQQAFIFYSAIILSFMSGTLWQKETSKKKVKLQLLSNILCLIAFACLLMPVFYALIILPITYVGLLLTEYLLRFQQQITASYIKMRLILTLLVVLSHVTALLLWY
ncbi:DUF3429 domain-containing protein [uncultured Psychromonas sp.]|uniref:DUF3429 domain-containing protein n=1 Tax=uncultured Psychromonas sp. TaxID=173974 RepID=UPI002610A495|nr:DUF3429 domain-containing protein [uncultured Psychromonas sp.]